MVINNLNEITQINNICLIMQQNSQKVHLLKLKEAYAYRYFFLRNRDLLYRIKATSVYFFTQYVLRILIVPCCLRLNNKICINSF